MDLDDLTDREWNWILRAVLLQSKRDREYAAGQRVVRRNQSLAEADEQADLHRRLEEEYRRRRGGAPSTAADAPG